MSTKKKIAFKGEVINEPSVWTSSSGTACCKFSVRGKDGIYECIAFHERANIEGLAKGKQVSVRGSYKDQDAFEGKSVTMDACVVEGAEATAKDKIIAEYGSIENYQEELRKAFKYKISQGMVLAKHTSQDKDGGYSVRRAWFHKDRCSRHPLNGEVWLNIDLCMNILGAAEVTRKLKAEGVELLSIGVNNALKYRECLDEMLLEVADTLAQEAPF